MSWELVKLGELITESRIPSYNPDPDRRITVRLNVLGVEKRPLENEKAGATKQFIRKAGQFIYGKQNFHKGAFGIIPDELDGFESSADLPSFDVREDCLSEWIFYFFKQGGYYLELAKIARGVATQRIHPEQIYDLEIPLPDIETQKNIITSIKAIEEKGEKLNKELTDQLTQLDNLKQAILQEAVQGHLVKQDPKDEPASELLKRIKAEKAKSGKKEKLLSPIKPEEIPFEIPENWVWCRLGEIANNVEYGTSHKAEMTSEHIPVLRMNNIQSGKLDYSNLKYVSKTIDDLPRLYLIDGDLLFNRTNSYELVGKTAVYRGSNDKMTFASYLIRVQFNDKIISEYISNYINSPICRTTQLEPEIIQQNGQANFNGTKLKNILIPLPPLAEQKRIVEEIERQLAKTKQLKEHIIANQQATEQLLKALLHQAFEVEEIEAPKPKGKVIELKPTNVDYYRRTVLAAEIVWQLHREPTLGHLKLQKLIYLCQKSAEMQLPTNFLRQAMGPYDNRLMRSIDKQLKEKKWFEYKKEEVFKYQPLEKAGQHHNDFIKYFSAESDSIQFIIDKFKTIKSDIVEIVATLYACMDNMLNENVIFSEALLIQRFYEWSEEKKKFSEKEVVRVFSRMKETGIIPKGYDY